MPLNAYVCSSCRLTIEPWLVHRLESTGMAQEDVYITHACECSGPDGFVYGRYDIHPMQLAYLMGWRIEEVTHRGDGGWEWEAPLKQVTVPHHDPRLVEMREELEFCHTVQDFDRLRGTHNGPPPAEPGEGDAPKPVG